MESFETRVSDKPAHLETLSVTDVTTYRVLQKTFITLESKYSFLQKLNDIRTFCQRGDSSDSRRCLTCGVCFLPSGIAINIRQLKILTSMTKTAINNQLYSIGYRIVKGQCALMDSMQQHIPQFKENPNLLKEWTIHKFAAMTPKPECREDSKSSSIFASPPPDPSPKLLPEPLALNVTTINQKSLEEDLTDFFDDPFCCPPMFLVEDAHKTAGIAYDWAIA